MRGFAAAVIGLGVLAGGCGDSSSESAVSGSSSGTAELTSTDATTGLTDPDSGAVPPGCGENLLEDPGFEGGSENSAWVDASILFDTPICDANCTDDVGANPFSGSWWVWFGGVAQADSASVRQTVLIPEGSVVLRFGFSVNAGSGTGNDVFSVLLDGEETLLQVDDRQAGSYAGWRVEELDIPSGYADGAEHELSFEATLAGVGLTSFFVDDVELRLCEQVTGSSSSSSSSTGEGSGDADSSGPATTSGS